MFAELIAVIFGLGTLVAPQPEQICSPSSVPLAVPILLYHHVAPNEENSRFTVTPSEFEAQMNTLVKHGYETITPGHLSGALQCGQALPDRPIMITFDDGHADVYQHAYPILEQYGFSAVMYVVANRTGVPDFLSVDEMKQLIHSGWEIGSHTMTHADLSELNDQDLETELTAARQLLEASLGVEINSLAYPFGSFSPDAARAAVRAGYTNAMGIGVSNKQSMANRFYFNRREVLGHYGQEEFMQLLANTADGSITSIKDAGGSASLSANSGEVGWSFCNGPSSTGSSGDSVQTIQ